MSDTLTRYGFRVGDQVVVKGWPPSSPLIVIDTSDRSLLVLETPSGATLKAGRLQITLVDRPSQPKGAQRE